MLNKAGALNLIGTVFDKGLVLFVAFVFSSKMSVSDFGQWSLFMQFVLIFNGILHSPIQSLFSRQFYEQSDKTKLPYFYSSLLIVVLLLFVISFMLWYNVNWWGVLYVTGAVFFGVFNYSSLSFRFLKLELKYVSYSILRFVLFVFLPLYVMLFYKEVTFLQLFVCFIVANAIIIIPRLRSFSLQKVSEIENREFNYLIIYGLMSTLINGIDRLFVSYHYGDEGLGYYAYIVFLTSASNLLVEVVKRTYVPKLYEYYSGGENMGLSTMKKAFLLMTVVQLLSPFILLEALKVLNLINVKYIAIDNLYLVILIQTLSFAIFSYYHFINPYFIYNKRSSLMLYSLLLSMFLYGVLMFFVKGINILELSIYRGVLLTSPVLSLILMKRYVKIQG